MINSVSNVRRGSEGNEEKKGPENRITKAAREAIECSICLTEISKRSGIRTSCGHTFHEPCLNTWATAKATHETYPCPNCRKPIQNRFHNVQNVGRTLAARRPGPSVWGERISIAVMVIFLAFVVYYEVTREDHPRSKWGPIT